MSDLVGNRNCLFYHAQAHILGCPAGTHGTYCSESCDCLNGAKCDRVTGACDCKPGFIGNTCEKCKYAVLMRKAGPYSLI